MQINNSWPVGYVFAPTDVEMIVAYLRKKLDRQPLPEIQIREVNIYAYDPDELAATYEPLGRSEWFFFTPRTRRHANGQRPDRSVVRDAHRRATATATGGDKETKSVREGHWKATAGDKEIKFEGQTVGYRKSLVFYRGNKKTNWIMYEYRVADPPRRSGVMSNDHIRFDDCVMCRIHNKDLKVIRGTKRSGDEYCRSYDQSPSRSKVPRLDHQHYLQKEAINQFKADLQSPQQQHHIPQQCITQIPEFANAVIAQDSDHQAWLSPNDSFNQTSVGLQIQTQQQQPITQIPEWADSLFPQMNNHQGLLNPNGAGDEMHSQQQQEQQPTIQLPDDYANAMFPGDNLQVLPHQAGTDVAVPNNDNLTQSLDFSTLDDDQWGSFFDTTDDGSAYFDHIMDLLQD